MTKSPEVQATSGQLDRIVQILEDIFILQASIAQMNRKKLRAVVGIEMRRVSRISKHIKPPVDSGGTEATPPMRPRLQQQKDQKEVGPGESELHGQS